MLPLSKEKLNEVIKRLEITDLTTATIRQICSLAAALEIETNEKFSHLEIGNPGLPASKAGIEAACKALKEGVANTYPNISGLPELKKAASDFIKAFLDLNIPPKYIVPTVGSMQGSYTLMTLLKQRDPKRNSIMMLYPGFPAQTHQAKMLGLDVVGFDIYDFRGDKLEPKLEEMLSSGKFTALIYSNPNNPAWTNLTDQELEIIGKLATKYDVIVIEDLAYMGMDIRKDYSVPFKEPFIPSIGKYTDNYILLISASKIFSYAGERIAVVAMSPEVYERRYPILEKFYEMPNFGECYVFGVLYTASSGATHSAQYALAAMFEKAAAGELNFIKETSEYARRAKLLKDLLLKNNFHIVYDKDGKEKISDGFFFTIGYKDLDSETLQRELLRYGISSISLPCTGSCQKGVRACVSNICDEKDMENFGQRLKKFDDEH